MKTFQAIVLGLAAACGLSFAAQAADLGGAPREREPVVYERSFSWTGLYVGAHVGYGWSDIDWREGGGFDGSHDGSGWLAGGQVGYNWQSGRFVYGVEGDISSTGIDGGNGCCGHSIDWLASIRGRAGMTGFDNRTLFYVTAGAAWADVTYDSFGSHSDTHFGWVAGAGIEHALTPNMTARVEYLYYGFDEISAPIGVGPASIDPSMHTVRFGLNFKF
jgi:outer membrane immunogenic protein